MKQFEGRKIAWFKNGLLFDVCPRDFSVPIYDDRQIAYDFDSIIISDESFYDPTRPETIVNLSIPNFSTQTASVASPVTHLDYILKIRCGGLERSEYLDEFITLTLKMMKASNIGWRREDYLQVIRNYYRLGLYDEGDQFEVMWRKENPDVFSNPYDETDECKHLTTKYYWENKNRKHKEYYDLLCILPEKMPKTVKGYLQMRTRKTKNYIEICRIAEGKEYVCLPPFDYHECKKKKIDVQIDIHNKQNESGIFAETEYFECPLHYCGKCDGRDQHGLYCIYPICGSKHPSWRIDFKHDPMLPKAIDLVVEYHCIREDFFQRKLDINAEQASRIIEELVYMDIAIPTSKMLQLDFTPEHDSYCMNMTPNEIISRYGIF